MLTASKLFADEQRSWFAERFNRSVFMFDHTLHESPIFDLPNLVEVSRRLPDAYYSTEDAGVTAGWAGEGRARPTVQETLRTIGETNSLVMLKGFADDPEFSPVFRRIMSGIKELVGPQLSDDVTVERATLIVSSPHRITPYHIDAETNFLFQLRGEKLVNVFDPNDRTLLTHRELERFYCGDLSAATYKRERQADARVFDFAPGKGLHIPILSPHWVQNGDSVSVAISINCSLRSNERLANLYKVNGLLRKAGLSPAPPGASAASDRLKLSASGALNVAMRARAAARERRKRP